MRSIFFSIASQPLMLFLFGTNKVDDEPTLGAWSQHSYGFGCGTRVQILATKVVEPSSFGSSLRQILVENSRFAMELENAWICVTVPTPIFCKIGTIFESNPCNKKMKIFWRNTFHFVDTKLNFFSTKKFESKCLLFYKIFAEFGTSCCENCHANIGPNIWQIWVIFCVWYLIKIYSSKMNVESELIH